MCFLHVVELGLVLGLEPDDVTLDHRNDQETKNKTKDIKKSVKCCVPEESKWIEECERPDDGKDHTNSPGCHDFMILEMEE